MSLTKMASVFASLCFFISGAFSQASIVNLNHLDYLNQKVKRNGETILLTHIYCEYPDYKWVDAAGEGISCVDDVARAAIVYLKHYSYKYSGHKKSLQKAKWALNFVMQMQAADGEFYNFVYKDMTINEKGKTSYKSTGFWAARGLWSLSFGYSVFRKQDPDYARRLQKHIKKSIKATQKFIEKYPYKMNTGFNKVPGWLKPIGADCWSIYLLGLVEYYQHHPSSDLKNLIVKIANAISNYQYGDFRTFPFGAHLSWGGNPNLWHGWGNRQTQALAFAARILGNKNWLLSAQKEATYFYSYLLTTHMLGELNPTPKLYEQIAYTICPIVEGFLELAKTTGEENWAKLAGITTSWFFGNNPHGAKMYDAKTGRCFDGLSSSSRINLNSGAESTIEALMALIDIENHKIGKNYIFFRSISTRPIHILKQEKTTLFLNTPGEYFCYFYSPKLSQMTLVVDKEKYILKKRQSYPLLQSYASTLFFNAGEHHISLSPFRESSVILQPVITSKTFSYKDRYIILYRDAKKKHVLLCENGKINILKHNFLWVKK